MQKIKISITMNPVPEMESLLIACWLFSFFAWIHVLPVFPVPLSGRSCVIFADLQGRFGEFWKDTVCSRSRFRFCQGAGGPDLLWSLQTLAGCWIGS